MRKFKLVDLHNDVIRLAVYCLIANDNQFIDEKSVVDLVNYYVENRIKNGKFLDCALIPDYYEEALETYNKETLELMCQRVIDIKLKQELVILNKELNKRWNKSLQEN